MSTPYSPPTTALLLVALLLPLQASADTLTGHVAYATVEEAAREKHVGLGADADPVPPWDSRKAKRNGGE